jgi:hypothetical protein
MENPSGQRLRLVDRKQSQAAADERWDEQSGER